MGGLRTALAEPMNLRGQCTAGTTVMAAMRINPAVDRSANLRPRRSQIVWLALIAALLLGLAARQYAYSQTESIRFTLNQENTFYWGDRLVHAIDHTPGAVNASTFWESYCATYAANEASRAPAIHTLDYVPLRLLMAGAWVEYLNIAYGPVSEWRPEFARSFTAFSMVMELLAAAAIFALVAVWMGHCIRSDPTLLRRGHGQWECAAAAAALIWLNPASIVDSHIWPHGQTWILPFYLGAVLAMLQRRFILAGAVFGVGSMLKGQMLMIAPLLLLWPIFDGRWKDSIRFALGLACGVALIVWPWLLHGEFAWARAGFGANGIYSDVLRKGVSLNLPALLDKFFGSSLHQHLIDTRILNVNIRIELKTMLAAMYFTTIVCCASVIARQERLNDRRLLVTIASPWALMFFLLGQMDERYLVWSATISSAAAVTCGRSALFAHLALTLAGVSTMLEFLLINSPIASPQLLHVLIQLNPINWLLTAGAVAILFGSPVLSNRRLLTVPRMMVDMIRRRATPPSGADALQRPSLIL